MTAHSTSNQSGSVVHQQPVHVEQDGLKLRGFPREGSAPGRHQALKYLASGWCTTSASVDCSGTSWNSSDSSTPIRSGVEQPHHLGPVLQVRAGGVAEGVARSRGT